MQAEVEACQAMLGDDETMSVDHKDNSNEVDVLLASKTHGTARLRLKTSDSGDIEEIVGETTTSLVELVSLWLSRRDGCSEQAEKIAPVCVDSEKCVRSYVLFHHVYSQKKTRKIRRLAAQHGVTGLFLLGKPGALVVEGEQVEAFVVDVKAIGWQRCQEVLRRRVTDVDAVFSGRHLVEVSELRELQNAMSAIGLSEDFNEMFTIYSKRCESATESR